MKLSEKLIELRKEKGWSQEEFAENLDVSRQAISRWENGTALPDAQNILGISKLFNVTADYLLNDDYESVVSAPLPEPESDETGQKANEEIGRQKAGWRRYLIPAICLIILAGLIIMIVVGMALKDKTSEVPIHPALKSVIENKKAATCTEAGSYDEVFYCTECGEEIFKTTKSVEKLAHTLSCSVIKEVASPTCTQQGAYDEVVCCEECGEEVLRTRRSIAMLDHKFENRVCVVCGEYQPSEGLFFMSSGDGTCIVDIGNCTDEEIVIPEYSPNGDKVTQIKANAFSGRSQIKSVRIPETVTLIGEGAFEDCTNLVSVNLPSKIQMIYSYTFSGCKKLKEITIPQNVVYIGEKAFANCLALESVFIPSNVTKIGSYAFENLSGGKGTVTFGIYNGWEVYDSENIFAAEVDFTSGSATPFEYLVFRFPEYIWKRNL